VKEADAKLGPASPDRGGDERIGGIETPNGSAKRQVRGWQISMLGGRGPLSSPVSVGGSEGMAYSVACPAAQPAG